MELSLDLHFWGTSVLEFQQSEWVKKIDYLAAEEHASLDRRARAQSCLTHGLSKREHRTGPVV